MPPLSQQGYYTIQFDSDASKICTIIFFRKMHLQEITKWVLQGSPDIVKAKAEMLELMESLELEFAEV